MSGYDSNLTKQVALSPGVQTCIVDIARNDPKYANRIKAQTGTVVAEAKKAYQAALEIGESQEGAAEDAERILAAGLSEVLFAEYGRRERYMRRAEELDAHAVEVSAWMSHTYEEMSLKFLSTQFDAIRRDIREDHSWYTGMEDTVRQLGNAARDGMNKVGNFLKDKVDPRAGFEVKQEQDKTFLQRVFEKHLSPNKVEEFSSTLGAELAVELSERWESRMSRVLQNAAVEFEKLSYRENALNQIEVDFEIDSASKAGIFGLAATATSTVVLAAGWHTLAWSMTGLFLPLLPIVALVTLGTAWISKDAAQKKLIEVVDEQEKSLVMSVTEGARYKLASEVRSTNEQAAESFKETIFGKMIGRFSSRLHARLLRALEDQLDDLGDRIGRYAPSDIQDARGPWLERAQLAIDSGDDLTAAMYAALAYEQLLRDLNRKLDMNFNFRVPHHNRAFLDRLSTEGKLSKDKLSTLRRLKERRDMFTHRLHQVAMMPESGRRKLTLGTIEDIAALKGRPFQQ